MVSRADIIASSEPVLDKYGFSGTGMDSLIKAAEVSSRTLYKHVGGRASLIAGVLDARGERFFSSLPNGGVTELFAALADWVDTEGARGCFFLRALSEAGHDDPAIAQRVMAHKDELAEHIAQCVEHDLGKPDRLLGLQVLVLFEGATHAAVYRGKDALEAAGVAAAVLLQTACREAADLK
ncbi:TetR/AcrR family transcriptional regulator [Stakelama sp. CBK3Z-3]|uniref:TetR/AcrR family transcriptional regulator n=1 Tax=Stakelama flava TaxID=2860338 RepID=A0ABS6XNX2_9SPHN|nr:TetR/AcrR family transcriptional regulator [Stakelama flava]MBW4331125.1 TetR/AcrR family transcriptional regulator [Stakelama flava]